MVLSKVIVDIPLGGGEVAVPTMSGWDDDFLRALGYLLVQANYLDDAFLDLFRLLKDLAYEDAVAATRGMMLGELSKATFTAYEKRFETGALRERLDAVKGELSAAIDARNAFIHASWSFDPAREQMHRERRPRKGPQTELRKMKVADVEEAIEAIGGAAETVWHLYDAVEIATRSSREWPATKSVS